MSFLAIVRIAGLALAVAATATPAQTVYKCEGNGKVVYSHDPCVGGQAIDTTPTQGLDKSSGTSRKGADVRAAESNKAMADAFRPLLRQTPEELATQKRRAKLLPEERIECAALDVQLPRHQAAVKAASPAAASADAALFGTRRRFRELRC